jgi:hypothetical protein
MTTQKAPKGKFRVIGVDTFEGPTADYLIGDYDTLGKAVAACNTHGGTMNPCYVFDDRGINLHKAGTF